MCDLAPASLSNFTLCPFPPSPPYTPALPSLTPWNTPSSFVHSQLCTFPSLCLECPPPQSLCLASSFSIFQSQKGFPLHNSDQLCATSPYFGSRFVSLITRNHSFARGCLFYFLLVAHLLQRNASSRRAVTGLFRPPLYDQDSTQGLAWHRYSIRGCSIDELKEKV